MEVDTETVLEGLRRLIAEEMHLVGQELEDSLDPHQSQRLAQLIETLDRAADLLAPLIGRSNVMSFMPRTRARWSRPQFGISKVARANRLKGS